MASNIEVAIRFRPNKNTEDQWRINGRTIASQNGRYNMEFDNVFSSSAQTSAIFNTVGKSIVQSSMLGYNGTIFAYGASGTGKTFTMKGVTELAIKELFEQSQYLSHKQFAFRVGFIEIYNDQIYDLLHLRSNLKIGLANGQVVVDQKEQTVTNEADILRQIAIGNGWKQMSSTPGNDHSSRSHTIFTITIEAVDVIEKTKTISKLNLVDLAGSEKPERGGHSFNEGLHINKSLLALGKIIRELSKSNSKKPNNYRESKLTRILGPAIAGNSKTAIICTVSPKVIEETYYTLT